MGWITDSISLNFYIICKLLFHVEKHCLMQNANPPFIWSKCFCFFFSFELLHCRLCLIWMFWSYFLCENVVTQKHCVVQFMFLTNREYYWCCYVDLTCRRIQVLQEKAGSGDDAEEKRLLSNPPGHTNDIWRGLPTGASLAKVITLPGFNSRLSQRANYSRVWQIAQIIKHCLVLYSAC